MKRINKNLAIIVIPSIILITHLNAYGYWQNGSWVTPSGAVIVPPQGQGQTNTVVAPNSGNTTVVAPNTGNTALVAPNTGNTAVVAPNPGNTAVARGAAVKNYNQNPVQPDAYPNVQNPGLNGRAGINRAGIRR